MTTKVKPIGGMQKVSDCRYRRLGFQMNNTNNTQYNGKILHPKPTAIVLNCDSRYFSRTPFLISLFPMWMRMTNARVKSGFRPRELARPSDLACRMRRC